MSTLTVLGVLIYIGIGFIQFLAIVAGVQEWLGIHWLVSGFVAFFLAYIPVVGTVTGIMGAVHGWHWTYPWAIGFFCWPYVLYLLATLGTLIYEFVVKKRARATLGIMVLFFLASPAMAQDTQAKGQPNCQLWNGFTYEQKTLFLLGYSQAITSLGAVTTLHGGFDLGKKAMASLWPAGMDLGDVGDAVSRECKKKENGNRQIGAMIFKLAVDVNKVEK